MRGLPAVTRSGGDQRKIETPDKENAQFEAGCALQDVENDPDYPAMVLANYMFGGSITARMPTGSATRKGSATARRRVHARRWRAALFSATVSSNPINTPKVEASFIDELKKTLTGGFTAAEVAGAKKAIPDSRKVGRRRRPRWPG